MKHLSLAMCLALGAFSAACADDDDQALEQQSKITRAQAQKIALERVPGTVSDTDIEKTSAGKLYWSVDVRPAKGGAEKEVEVDATSGAVLSVKDDDD